MISFFLSLFFGVEILDYKFFQQKKIVIKCVDNKLATTQLEHCEINITQYFWLSQLWYKLEPDHHVLLFLQLETKSGLKKKKFIQNSKNHCLLKLKYL